MRRFWRSGDSTSKRVLDVLEFFLSETVLRLSRYERKEIENRRFRTNAVGLILIGSPLRAFQ